MNKLTITSTAQLRQALEQFYAATATPEVIEALTDYFSTHPQVDAEFEADRAIILAMAEAASIEEPDDMEQRILAATCGSPRRTMWRRIRLWHVAASAVAVFAIASLWLFQPNSDAVADTSLIAKADTVATIQPQPAQEPQQPEQQSEPAVQKYQPRPTTPTSRTRVVTDPEEAAQILASTLQRARNTIARATQSPEAIDPALNSINNSLNSIQQ